MISKKLLSEILGVKVNSIEGIDNNTRSILFYNDYDNEINIYELAHMCKEWVVNQGVYFLHTSYSKQISCMVRKQYDYDSVELFKAPTEPETIFKACQWLLDNKEKQNESNSK